MWAFQLEDCLSEELQQKIFDKNQGSRETEQELLEDVEKLVCKQRNKVVRMVDFMKLRQKKGESIEDIVTRIKGEAEQCGFTEICECTKRASYKDQLVMIVLILSLLDDEMQEKAMALGNSANLNRVVELLESIEAGKTAKSSLDNNPSAVNAFKRTEYKKKQEQGRRPNSNAGRSDNSNSNSSNSSGCKACGSKDHHSGENERRLKYSAFQQECTRCKRIGHLSNSAEPKKLI